LPPRRARAAEQEGVQTAEGQTKRLQKAHELTSARLKAEAEKRVEAASPKADNLSTALEISAREAEQ